MKTKQFEKAINKAFEKTVEKLDAKNKYNGWANYETWRVMLEIFDGMTLDDGEKVDAEWAENYVLDKDYPEAFLNDVDWHEIAEAINESA